MRKLADNINLIVGGIALSLILGALSFQYIGRFAPCPICHWQRWPLIAAALIGIIGHFVTRNLSPAVRQAVTTATILLVSISGAIGIYHTGIELGWWPGPASCTGNLFVLGAPIDPNAYVTVPCDKAAWLDPVFGISLAGYNAIISLGTAVGAAIVVRMSKKA